jgi:FKBP-type peptidyl-prolyl cis-trans isomerase
MKNIFLLITLLTSFLFFSSCSNDDISPTEQLSNDVATIEAYLEDNNIDYESHVSGLRYVIHDPGTGTQPGSTSNVVVTYEGRFLTTGEEFDANENLEFNLFNVIIGWRIGIPLIAEGGRITLYIPSGLAYGPNGNASIPPNAILIFDVDLIEVN